MVKREPVLLASTNPAKREMLAWLLKGLGLTVVGPQAVPSQPQVEETAPSHADNAVLKAVAWSRAYGGMAIASDGGLRIEALGPAWDSLYTARFAGPEADDLRRLEGLLERMAPYSGEERRATWQEAVAVARAGELLDVWEAQGGDGLLATSFDPERMVPGFWVATIWYFPTLGKYYSELSEAERREVGEPWSLLKPRVEAFFRQGLNP